ncbi:hypothetical protein quinque_013830 [Culex quinquefasciatus]
MMNCVAATDRTGARYGTRTGKHNRAVLRSRFWTCFGTIARTRTASKARGAFQPGTGKHFRVESILRKYLGTKRQKAELMSKKINVQRLPPVHQRARTRANIREKVLSWSPNRNPNKCRPLSRNPRPKSRPNPNQKPPTHVDVDPAARLQRDGLHGHCDRNSPRDYYTRVRSTPRGVHLLGDKSDLTATEGFEVNGTTTIVFRRKLAANKPTDYSIVGDLMHVIWAKGQESSKFTSKLKAFAAR